MQHWSETPEGQERVERIDVERTLPPSPEEVRLKGGGGGKADQAHPEPPAQGPEVAVDDVGLINLSDAPPGQHWFT